MNFAFRFLLTFNATSLLLIIFFVQNGYSIDYFTGDIYFFNSLPKAVSYFIYFVVPVLLTKLSIWLSTKLGKDEFKKNHVNRIENANNSFLPSYLGYFFVALSIGSWEALWFVYGIVFLFTFLSQALYFNPLFLIFGYDFYNIETKNGTVLFLISCHKYKIPEEVEISEAYRINDYTYMERESNNG